MATINIEDTLDITKVGEVPLDPDVTNFVAEVNGEVKRISGASVAQMAGSTPGGGNVFVTNTDPSDDEANNVEVPLLDADSIGGKTLAELTSKSDLTDAFSTEKNYAVGDYCIYLNQLYRFTSVKEAGEWNPDAVTPVLVMDEIKKVEIMFDNSTIQTIEGYSIKGLRCLRSGGTIFLRIALDCITPTTSGYTYFQNIIPKSALTLNYTIPSWYSAATSLAMEIGSNGSIGFAAGAASTHYFTTIAYPLNSH